MISRARSALIGLALLSTIGLWACDRKAASGTIGLVVTSIDNPYFVEMANAAKAEASKEPSVRLSVQAPERGAVDIERQQQLVEGLIAQHVGAVLVVPADSHEILTTLAHARAAKVPVIILDNDIDRKAAATMGLSQIPFIGSNNVSGGKLAGQFLANRLGPEGGEVALLEGVPGVQAAVDRKTGFLQAIQNSPSIRLVASQAADWDREKAYNITKAIITAHPNLKAIFGSNDEMALGAVRAIKDLGRAKNIFVVGYDGIPSARAAVEAGDLAATVAQQPAIVGRFGVDYARRLMKQEPIPSDTDVPLTIVTRPT